MKCKITPAKRKGPNAISFSILTLPGWFCEPHHTYFGTNLPEPKPKTCPIAIVKVSKPKKRK